MKTKNDIWAEVKVEQDERQIMTNDEQAEAWRDMKIIAFVLMALSMCFIIAFEGKGIL